MDIITAAIFALVSVIATLGILGYAADRLGVDSRPTIGDSHVR